MATATITVQEIRPPKPGGKKNVVVDMTGDFYYVWPDKIANYQVGSTYEVNFTASDFRGSTIRNIDSAVRSSAPAQAARAPAGGGAAGAHNGGQDHRDESIFVNMTLKESIRANLLDPNNEEEVVRLGRLARSAHKKIWAPMQAARAAAPQRQPDSNMNDAIPF